MTDRLFPSKFVLFALCLVCLVGGCTSSKEPRLVPVSGTVKVGDKPLDVGWVTFHPDESQGNTSTALPWAEIQKDGTYSLSTNGKPGAPLGFYKVVVTATRDPIPAQPPPPRDGKPWQPRWLHNAKYALPATTDLLIEVTDKPAPASYDLPLSP